MSQPNWTHEEIEAQIREIQAKAKANASNGDDASGVPLATGGPILDSAIYGAADKFADYVTSIAANDDDDEDDDDDSGTINSNGSNIVRKTRVNVNAPASLFKDVIDEVSCYLTLVLISFTNSATLSSFYSLQDHDPLAENRVPRVIDREDEYRRRHRKAVISPERADPFLEGIVSLFFHIFKHIPVLVLTD